MLSQGSIAWCSVDGVKFQKSDGFSNLPLTHSLESFGNQFGTQMVYLWHEVALEAL